MRITQSMSGSRWPDRARACLLQLLCLLACCAVAGSPVALADAGGRNTTWAVDPTVPGPDLPPVGRSLFDHLIALGRTDGQTTAVPFPFQALVQHVRARLEEKEYLGGTRLVMIPLGRSLQRTAAAPDFFAYPRMVFAVTGGPAVTKDDPGMLLEDRLYIGYVEKTGILEVISYNEAAGRFEFQLVEDYRAGGQPHVAYANRAVCIACHQNHAPIFSQATWGETNANGHIADLIRARRGETELSGQANIDFPDDIDKATVRASALLSAQAAWQRGCEDTRERTRAMRCRAGAFLAVLQFGLTGRRDFDSGSTAFADDFLPTFTQVWRQTWPQGMASAQSSLPDRNPFGMADSSIFGTGESPTAPTDWAAAAHVPPRLDPLLPRPPRETWRFSGALDARKFIAAWSRLFAQADFRALDGVLVQRGRGPEAARTVYRGDCTASADERQADAWNLRCKAAAGSAMGVDAALHLAGSGRSAEWLNFGPAGQVRELRLVGPSAAPSADDPAIRLSPAPHDTSARLPDGRAVEAMTLDRMPSVPSAGARAAAPLHLTVVVVDDFAPVRGAVERMIADADTPFDASALARARLMPRLLEKLGEPGRRWCCHDASALPPARTEQVEAHPAALADPLLQPFFEQCGVCHLGHGRFPPNFLTGDPDQVQRNLRQCAPRMAVRLSAWHTPAERRIKSPMPPELHIASIGLTAQRWADSHALATLRERVEGFLRSAAPVADQAGRGEPAYEALPRCLADSPP